MFSILSGTCKDKLRIKSAFPRSLRGVRIFPSSLRSRRASRRTGKQQETIRSRDGYFTKQSDKRTWYAKLELKGIRDRMRACHSDRVSGPSFRPNFFGKRRGKPVGPPIAGLPEVRPPRNVWAPAIISGISAHLCRSPSSPFPRISPRTESPCLLFSSYARKNGSPDRRRSVPVRARREVLTRARSAQAHLARGNLL